MKFARGVPGAHRMKPSSFGDPLTLSSAITSLAFGLAEVSPQLLDWSIVKF